MNRCVLRAVIRLLIVCGFAVAVAAQQFNPALFQDLRWRMIGPHRGGRTVAVAGFPERPNTLLIGVNNGGVWKTTDFGHTWDPIFENQPTQSVGALAVAPSDPDVIFVGSGEGLRRPDLSIGDGIYKSKDGGKTWTHLGLRDAQQIGAILVDPKDPDRVFVAALGHPYGPNPERGVFRSLDGGRNWEKVLSKDDDTGAIDLAFDPTNPQTVYAVLWTSRRPPWTTGNSYDAPGSGLYKSSDGGATWRPLTQGLPTAEQGLGRIGITIAPTDPKRMYALVDAPQLGGVYRSEDAGESWTRINGDARLWGRGSDFANVRVHPKDRDVVFIANVSTYRSSDAGKSFTAIKGAPGGDDYHTVWINPLNPDIILLASDQGATVTVNGGATWSSWYNQPTAQFYHVITDSEFPYWVYGGQQESGSAGVASRSDFGSITFREWYPVGVEEYGYVAPDPLNPNLIYGGRVTRFDRTTGQTQDVSPVIFRNRKYRFNRTAPLIFAHANPHMLLLGSNVLFKTTDGGAHWEEISPDLTREDPGVPANLGVFAKYDPKQGKHRGVIYSIGPSFRDVNSIWVGTDDGLIHRTQDGGKTWRKVTPPELTPWSKVAQIEASHFDDESAYAAVNRFRLDDLHPYIYRTHDGGKTWQNVVQGMPNEPVNAVREDPVRRGLLFAATERGVYASWDDGDHWQSLRLNLPATSVRDLVVHGDDLVVGTHGRSFWILDNITPLRQLRPEVASAKAHLFEPQLTYRLRRNNSTDTPLPPEIPAGKNPPDGAMIDFFLNADAAGAAVVEILDSVGNLVRRFSSADAPESVDANELNHPTYWVRSPRPLPATAGMHRFLWDLRYPPPDSATHEFPISAIYRDTPREPLGVYALPGRYSVKLTVGGESMTQPLVLKMDPRVKTSEEDLRRQFDAATHLSQALDHDVIVLREIQKLRQQLKAPAKAGAATPGSMETLDRRSAELEEQASDLNADLVQLLAVVNSADAAPNDRAASEAEATRQAVDRLVADWQSLRQHQLMPQ